MVKKVIKIQSTSFFHYVVYNLDLLENIYMWELSLAIKYVSTNTGSWRRKEISCIRVVRGSFIEEVVIVIYSFRNLKKLWMKSYDI